ncbi:MAG: hypothetical protein A3D74_03655 [Candidatus Levybacteria bacterium RIFCSPHIGHO2_02_FULL_37_13]|nr:MAG: hypothetical protein A3D74_03655 [Candidatus Levybacteria bacterium RIFCSPHIGHO2_02_FULL_37_13]OGH30647.1 MAG: hypothetical protein A3E40_04020 [Candidatus Levybacteria bacterium RIFCSPHIGHO2_12_FULL_37_9]OGH39505.1 MAG: hypothetical protein A3B41_00625 [Candidatus Levybacteria bacterium RIFCSPLOWO2_01_FULL_37_26]
MRDGYVRFAKKYIEAHPEYKNNLSSIKASLISFGAREEEFNEAMRQITGLPNYSDQFSVSKLSFPKISFTSFKKTASATVAILAFISIGYTTFLYKPSVESTKTPLAITNNITKNVNTTSNNPIVPKVYANVAPIDSQRVFSFPKSSLPLLISSAPKKEVLGFFPYWMLSQADKIELSHLTSISLFGLSIDGKGNVITSHSDSQADGGWGMWKDPKLDSLIKTAKSKGLKVYLTFKSFNNTDIENLVSSDSAVQTFISNALYFVNSKNLDGINLDFEYIGSPTDNVRNGFTRLVINLNTELKRQIPTGILTIDTYIMSGSVRDLFDLQALSKNTDAFVIMGYDMHYSLGPPGPISPMGGAVNIIGLMQGYLEKVPPEKIILAVPYYAYDWPITLDSSIGSPSAAIISYAEIAQVSKVHNLIWDETSQTPSYKYTDKGTQREVHFENVRSLGIKYDFVSAKNLKGVGIWALGYDGLNSDLQRLIVDKFAN